MTYSRLKGKRSGIVRVCAAEGCTNEFYAYPSHTGHRFCSRPCAYASKPKAKMSTRLKRSQTSRGTRTGVDNPNFKHGRRVGENIRGWSIREKGESNCRVCGGGAEDLHHAVPRSICPPDAKLDLRNGLPLCKPCHQKWHRKSLVLGPDVFTTQEWEYVSSLKLTGRDITGWLEKNYPKAREAA